MALPLTTNSMHFCMVQPHSRKPVQETCSGLELAARTSALASVQRDPGSFPWRKPTTSPRGHRSGAGPSSERSRLSARRYSAFRGCSPSAHRSHDPSPSTQPWRTPSCSPSSLTCFNCGKPRHFATDCRASRNKVLFYVSRHFSIATVQGPTGPARGRGRGYRWRGRYGRGRARGQENSQR